ncbi:hypothetical protein IAT38_002560 [Cryptococcus sp. DSM 104549]
MAGPVLYETHYYPAMPSQGGQELMTDWTPTLGSFGGSLRREKEAMMERANSSPYHAPPPSGPIYGHGQTLIVNGPSPSYHLPYPTMSGSHFLPYPPPHHRQSPSPLAHSHTYYPTSNGHGHPPPPPHGYGNEYDVFSASSHAGSPSPYAAEGSFHAQQQYHHMQQQQRRPGGVQDGELLTRKTLERPYDPYYAGVTRSASGSGSVSGSEWVLEEPPAVLPLSKKKRGKQPVRDGPPAGQALKTPKRQRADEPRSTKRMRVDESGGHRPMYTPPNEISTPLSSKPLQRPGEPMMTPIAEAPEIYRPVSAASHRTPSVHSRSPIELPPLPVSPSPSKAEPPVNPSHRPLVITRHHEEGRKLGLLGVARGELEARKSPEEAQLSPRMTTIDVIETDEMGMASLKRGKVLETEAKWWRGEREGSPSEQIEDEQLRTPVRSRADLPPANDEGERESEAGGEADAEVEADSSDDEEPPEVKAQKVTRRLQAFFNQDFELENDDQPLVSTRIEMFGRVAVRKSHALSFLDLSSEERARAVEEERAVGGDDEWREAGGEASGSRVKVRPLWPDDEAPWAFAGGAMKDRVRREESERARLLRRYLEAPSDESDDEGEYEQGYYETSSTGSWGKGKGKSVVRLLPPGTREAIERRRRGTKEDGSARAALLSSLRNRNTLPVIPGMVACSCGGGGGGSMVSCAQCKTWHHLQCCGIEDVSKIGSEWWCAGCTSAGAASVMRTPMHMSSRGHPSSHHSHHSHHSQASRGSYRELDPRSSAVKSDIDHIALAPSPMFVSGSHPSSRTPVSRATATGSPRRPQRSRVLSYGSDMWAFQEDAAPPSTPAPVVHDRYSTPRMADTPFDVTSTPSRHLDFNFGQPSLFSLTPLGGRSRVPSTMLVDGTPILRVMPRNTSGVPGPAETMSVPSRADFFRELNKGGNGPHSAGPSFSLGSAHHHGPAMSLSASASLSSDRSTDRQAERAERENITPTVPNSPRWPPHGLLGAHNLSPSPFGGHKRTLSGNKLSSMRSSSRSGLGSGLGLGSMDESDE